MSTCGILPDYNKKKNKIKRRIFEFEEIWRKPDKRIFAELCFCICTPQSKAKKCWEAVSKLYETHMLFKGTSYEIALVLKRFGVRFYKTKAKRIVEARKYLPIKEKIKVMNLNWSREWLVKHIKGLGYKEASHFLRNIGVGEKFAILDRHIMRNLIKFKVIEKLPKSMSPKIYIEIEQKMKQFANKNKIPLCELDLLFWSMETGSIFK